jgi:hypothetical protein
MVALTGIEPNGCQFSPVQFGLSVCKHVHLVSAELARRRYEFATLSLGCHSASLRGRCPVMSRLRSLAARSTSCGLTAATCGRRRCSSASTSCASLLLPHPSPLLYVDRDVARARDRSNRWSRFPRSQDFCNLSFDDGHFLEALLRNGLAGGRLIPGDPNIQQQFVVVKTDVQHPSAADR